MSTTQTEILEQMGRAEEAFTVRRVFGEPFEKDGVTVIPAARIQGAAGGGGGEAPGGEGAGAGSGFAMNTKPFGVFVVKDGDVAWRPAIDVNRVILGGQVVNGFVVSMSLGTRVLHHARYSRLPRLRGFRNGLLKMLNAPDAKLAILRV